MNIRTSSIVFALSCITLGGVVYSQSASLSAGSVGAHPFASISASYETLAQAEIQGMDRKVTKKFEGSTLEEILSWLSNEKLSFIADLSNYKNARISLSFDNVKLGEALDSIATMFDAHWERKGGVFLLKPSAKVAKAPANDVVTRAPLALRADTLRSKTDPMIENDDDFQWIVPGLDIADKSDIMDRIEIRSKDGKTQAFRYDPKTRKMAPIDLKELKRIAPNVNVRVGDLPEWSVDGHAPMIWSSEGQAYKIDPKTGKKVPLSKAEKEKLEKEWQAWGEKFGKEWEKWGEEYGKQWEGWAKDFEKQMQDGKGKVFVMPKMPDGAMPKFDGSKMPQHFYYLHDGKTHEMTPQQKKAFEESMKAMEKSLKEMKISEKVFDEKAMKELHEHLQKMKLPEGSVKFMDPKALEELKGLKLDGAKIRVMDKAAMKELERHMKELKADGSKMKMLDPNALKELEALKGLRTGPIGELKAPLVGTVLTSEKINKILDSLTPDQRSKHKERGYIKWSELTPAQKELLGMKGDGSFSVSFTIGDRTLTIKND